MLSHEIKKNANDKSNWFNFLGYSFRVSFSFFPQKTVKAYFEISLSRNLSLGMFLGCSYFFTISEADVLINSVLRQNTACNAEITRQKKYVRDEPSDRRSNKR